MATWVLERAQGDPPRWRVFSNGTSWEPSVSGAAWCNVSHAKTKHTGRIVHTSFSYFLMFPAKRGDLRALRGGAKLGDFGTICPKIWAYMAKFSSILTDPNRLKNAKIALKLNNAAFNVQNSVVSTAASSRTCLRKLARPSEFSWE